MQKKERKNERKRKREKEKEGEKEKERERERKSRFMFSLLNMSLYAKKKCLTPAAKASIRSCQDTEMIICVDREEPQLEGLVLHDKPLAC